MIQAQTKPDPFVYIRQDIKSWQGLQIPVCISPEDPVVKPLDIESDDQVGLVQMFEKGIKPLFLKGVKPFFNAVKEDCHGDPHEMGILPPPHVLGGLLGLKVQAKNPGTFRSLRDRGLFGGVGHGFRRFLGRNDFAQGDVPQEAFEDQPCRLFVQGFIAVAALWGMDA